MRIALLGVGRLGAAHAATLAALHDVTELRIHDADAFRAGEVAASCGARATGSADEALDGADGAVIVTPTPTHAPLIRRCVDAGIATFCEKPVAIGLAETREIVAHVEAARGRLQIGFQRRFDAGYVAARDALRNGALGTVYSFYMTSRDALPPPDDYVATSGGQFKDQLIHDFDITRWLFGEEVEEVIATGSTLGFDQYRALGDVATSAVLLRLAGGTLGLVNGARHNPAGYDIRVEIYGSRDSIAIGLDERAPIRSVERDARALAGPAYPSFFVRFGAAYREELAHFLSFARGEAANPCTAADALEALRIAEAAQQSWREARPVRLSEIA
jgi:myo-inositol 2-dehydrogenase / D-chiro-inositol 1-dehydrogenase